MKWLLRPYPRSWRQRYGEEFAALLDQQRMTPRVIADVILGAIDAHIGPHIGREAMMSQFNNKPAFIGFAFLAVPLFFLLAVLLKYGLGIGYLFDPLESYVYGPNPRDARAIVMDILVIFGPVVALLVNLMSVLQPRIGLEQGGIVGTVMIRGSLLSIAAIAVSLGLITIFGLYIITENAAEAAIRRYLGG